MPMRPLVTHPPPETIATARLLLRLPLPGDGAAVHAAIHETFAELHVWMDWAQHLPAVHETEAVIQQAHRAFTTQTDFPYLVFLQRSGRFAGATGLHPRDWAVPRFELGYWCRTSCQGHGYVTEAVQALTHVGFAVLSAHKLEIRCDPQNVRSRRVAERAGYTLEARLRNDKRRPDGALRDTLVYARLPEDDRPAEVHGTR